MAPYNRRMNMQRIPKAEVVHIDPPKPAPMPKPASTPPSQQTRKLLDFSPEDWLLLGLMMLFLQSEEEEYSMMLPALIYIFLG